MPPITSIQISELQQNSENIRNICILAHVDHGKTSLSDCLLATNGIISPKLAGRVRYLDSRADEQLRGITMESSAISLYFKLMRRKAEAEEPKEAEFLINLIDSPGHIDFLSEVSTASRLCDGAIVLVDAVEGVCSQTVTVLRQTWIEHIRPILVINKLDRLVTELKLSPAEAYTHLAKLLGQVNAVMGSFFAGERMEDDLKWRETLEKRLAAKATEKSADAGAVESLDGEFLASGAYEEKDDEDIYFAPEKGNVIFSSAIDGWAFTVKQFASMYEKKLGMNKGALEKFLWGDYYLDPKTKRVLGQKHLKGRNLKPMFVQLVLETVWAVYDSTIIKRDQEKIEKIIASLGLKILPRELKSKDMRSLLVAIFSQWLPLSTAVLVSVIEQLPSPPAAQKQRMPLIVTASPGGSETSKDIRNAIVNFKKGKGVPVIAYVSKLITVPESELKRSRRAQLSADELREEARKKRLREARKLAEQAAAEAEGATTVAAIEPTAPNGGNSEDQTEDGETQEDKEELIGFARLYSGTIRVGQQLYVLGPKYSPASPNEHIQKVTVESLYYIMGRGVQPLGEVPAGNVFGIGGLKGKVLKSGTLCSLERGGINLAGVNMGAAPIVRVALEPENPSEIDKMVEGLKLLEQADPCLEYVVQDNGEHVILTAGELHLERCLKDLRERFAKIEIQASAPIVPFRESIVNAAEMSPPKSENLPRGTVHGITPSKYVSIRMHIRPLPAAVTEFLVENGLSIKRLYQEHREREVTEADEKGEDTRSGGNDALLESSSQSNKLLSLTDIKSGLQKAFAQVPPQEKEFWADVVERVVSFGPRRIGPNLLIDKTPNGLCQQLLRDNVSESQRSQHIAVSSSLSSLPSPSSYSPVLTPGDFEDKIIHAFQLSTFQGPLCHEPMQGVAVFVEQASVNIPEEEIENARSKFGKLVGEVLSLAQNCIKQGFLDWSPRLLLAMYSCEIQASTEVLGKVYAVITRRRGRIVAEEMKEGTPFFTIKALLPVVESFGFGDDIRKRTSGAASPQLIFSGYEMLDEDPFWVPFTEDELEDLGELADRENVAKKYMDGVRKRKGLFIQKKLVANADKQRTLKK